MQGLDGLILKKTKLIQQQIQQQKTTTTKQLFFIATKIKHYFSSNIWLEFACAYKEHVYLCQCERFIF